MKDLVLKRYAHCPRLGSSQLAFLPETCCQKNAIIIIISEDMLSYMRHDGGSGKVTGQ
jgi:hypothetical protein